MIGITWIYYLSMVGISGIERADSLAGNAEVVGIVIRDRADLIRAVMVTLQTEKDVTHGNVHTEDDSY